MPEQHILDITDTRQEGRKFEKIQNIVCPPFYIVFANKNFSTSRSAMRVVVSFVSKKRKEKATLFSRELQRKSKKMW
jgi:hypothetical protein